MRIIPRVENGRNGLDEVATKSLATVGTMVIPPEKDVPEPPCKSSGNRGTTGLLLSRDLIFTSKIKSTAAELGYSMMVADTETLAQSMIETHRPSVIFVDLNARMLVAPGALLAYQRIAGPNTWFVAFGSHVETGALSAAKAAGCHVVLTRSRFSAELPELIRRFFNELPTQDGQARACAKSG